MEILSFDRYEKPRPMTTDLTGDARLEKQQADIKAMVETLGQQSIEVMLNELMEHFGRIAGDLYRANKMTPEIHEVVNQTPALFAAAHEAIERLLDATEKLKENFFSVSGELCDAGAMTKEIEETCNVRAPALFTAICGDGDLFAPDRK